MKTYIEQETRMMCVSDLVKQAGGTYMKHGGLNDEMFNFEAFLLTLPQKKQKEARALVELYKRSLNCDEMKVIKSSCGIYSLLSGCMTGLANEEFWMITMNNASKVISRRRISVGGIDQTTVDVRLIIKYALQDNATQIAVAHNHPSGNLKPSTEDISITDRIKKTCDMMRIRLVDHVIFSNGNYYSFHDQGLL